MNTYYSNQKNTLLLIALLKKHGIKKIVASPGTSNMPFVASVQQDEFFEIYSCIDERSAAYMACGLSVESGEPVVITCTGATASRNYMSALTEAFYRKIPILAITSTQDISRIGQNSAQLIDRRTLPNDIAKMSLHLPTINTEKEEKNYSVLINSAILELTRNGGGPVHINLTIAEGRKVYNVKDLPSVSIIKRYTEHDNFPAMYNKYIGIFVGSHNEWDSNLLKQVETFCEKYNAVVLVDSISNYRGKYAVFSNIVTYQGKNIPELTQFDLLIYIGDIIGTDIQGLSFDEVWRVNPDGEVRDTFGKLSSVFAMEEVIFFEKYNSLCEVEGKNKKINKWRNEIHRLRDIIPELPFSNIWVAQNTFSILPPNSVIHFGIQNSLRCWNFFEGPTSIRGYCNTGGFGIDGNVSSLIGASLCHKDIIYYGVVGDLAFFYDLNSLGNRHIGDNLRLLVINNNGGQQFRNHDSSGKQFGKDVNTFMAAAGHFGNQSKTLVRDYAKNLGFVYYCANNKDEYLKNLSAFVSNKIEKSMIFEVFLCEEDETIAMERITHLEESNLHKGKQIISRVIGVDGANRLANIIKK